MYENIVKIFRDLFEEKRKTLALKYQFLLDKCIMTIWKQIRKFAQFTDACAKQSVSILWEFIHGYRLHKLCFNCIMTFQVEL